MARPSIDLEVHALHGTTRRAKDGESHVAGSLPRPPKDLSKEERKRFKAHARMLAERRAVTSGDATVLSILVRTETRCIIAQEKIATEGLVVECEYTTPKGDIYTVKKHNLHLKILENGERQCIQILKSLGLTPKDREAVRPTSPVKVKNPPAEPNSLAGMDAELKALRAQQAEEETAPEPEIDLDALLKEEL